MQATGHEQFKRSQLPSHCRCGRKAATKGFVIQCTSEQMSGQKVRLVCKQRDQVVPEAVTNNLARFDGSTAQFNPIFAKNSGRGRTFSLWAEVLSREKEEVELTIDLLLPIKVTADGPRKRSADRTPSRASKSKLQSKQSSSVRCHSTLAVQDYGQASLSIHSVQHQGPQPILPTAVGSSLSHLQHKPLAKKAVQTTTPCNAVLPFTEQSVQAPFIEDWGLDASDFSPLDGLVFDSTPRPPPNLITAPLGVHSIPVGLASLNWLEPVQTNASGSVQVNVTLRMPLNQRVKFGILCGGYCPPRYRTVPSSFERNTFTLEFEAPDTVGEYEVMVLVQDKNGTKRCPQASRLSIVAEAASSLLPFATQLTPTAADPILFASLPDPFAPSCFK
eukprot:m.161050 g.161050  ORF g.161050 m.161050 type:complete len:389 (-) comp14358_c1_seq2:794-1960(-)